MEIKKGEYRAILADPPWRYRRGKGARAASDKHYETLSIKEIEGFKGFIQDLVHPEGSHLWLWTTHSMMLEARDVMAEWGFSYKTMVVWVKGRTKLVTGESSGQSVVYPEFELFRGMGFYTRGSAEYLLFGVRGKLARQTNKSISNVIVEWPTKHSRKPLRQYDVIEAISPGPRFEMFARKIRPGWEGFGDQLEE